MKLHVFFATALIFVKEGNSISSVSILPALCGTTAPRSSGAILKAHAGVDDGNGTYPALIPRCRYIIQATTAAHKLRFNVGTGRDEVNGIFHVMGCLGARMGVLDSDGMTILANLCGGVIDRSEYLSTGDNLTLEIFSLGGNDTILNFTAQYTSFLDSANCTDDPSLFPCLNGRCVSREGQCDVTLINNCGDFSDNSGGPPGNCSSEEPPEPTVAETTMAATMAAATAAATAASPSPEEADLLWVAGLAIGLVGSYFLYWLLWRPGYLVWRCSCWRHLSCCKSCLSKSPTFSLGTSDVMSKQPISDIHNDGKCGDGSTDVSPTSGNAESGMNSSKFESSVDNNNGGNGPFELGPKRVHPAPEPLFGIQRESHFFST